MSPILGKKHFEAAFKSLRCTDCTMRVQACCLPLKNWKSELSCEKNRKGSPPVCTCRDVFIKFLDNSKKRCINWKACKCIQNFLLWHHEKCCSIDIVFFILASLSITLLEAIRLACLLEAALKLTCSQNKMSASRIQSFNRCKNLPTISRRDASL